MKLLEQEPYKDCVSRQAVLDMATTIQTDDCSGNEVMEVVDVDDIRALPFVTLATKWTPVSESLPKEHFCDDGWVEPSDTVLIQFNNGEMTTSRYWGSGPRPRHKDEPWIDIDYPTTLEVVAWMPLPESYEVESEEHQAVKAVTEALEPSKFVDNFKSDAATDVNEACKMIVEFIKSNDLTTENINEIYRAIETLARQAYAAKYLIDTNSYDENEPCNSMIKKGDKLIIVCEALQDEISDTVLVKLNSSEQSSMVMLTENVKKAPEPRCNLNVTCKDCKHRIEAGCMRHGIGVYDSFYCKEGERNTK